MSQLISLGQWTQALGEVCVMYDFPTAPEAMREHMREFAAEIGRCADASLGTNGAALATTATASAEEQAVLQAAKPNPRELAVQSAQRTLTIMAHPLPDDAWRRARLPALGAFLHIARVYRRTRHVGSLSNTGCPDTCKFGRLWLRASEIA